MSKNGGYIIMLNKVVLMGRITEEPELKHTTSGVAVTRFTIAVERNFKDANGERAVDFINIAAWRNNAEVVCKYFHKGSLICVGGSIETGTYTDKNGNKKYSFGIHADDIYFTGERKESTGQSKSANSGYPAPQGQSNNRSAKPVKEVQQGNNYSQPSQQEFEDMPMLSDDDLPF